MFAKQTIGQWLRDSRGATIIEFALVAPVFIAIIIAILEMALVYLAQAGLDTAAEAAGRLLMTGQAQQGNMSRSQFETAACEELPPFLQCDKLMIDVTTVANFSNANTGAPVLTYDKNENVTNSFSYSPGGQGAIVVVRLMYLWPTATAPLGFNISNETGNNRLLIATSVLKSEYY